MQFDEIFLDETVNEYYFLLHYIMRTLLDQKSPAFVTN